jgi:uncharacterized membrane protein
MTHGLYLLSVWLHIVAAAVWMGGMVFLGLVLIPVIRRPEYRSAAPLLIHLTGVRFRTVGWTCLGLLLLTGVVNVVYRGLGWADLASAAFWRGGFGGTLAIKLVLVATILLLSAVHDFFIGPRATALLRADPSSPETARFRRQASLMGRINLLLALAAVGLGVMLIRGGF